MLVGQDRFHITEGVCICHKNGNGTKNFPSVIAIMLSIHHKNGNGIKNVTFVISIMLTTHLHTLKTLVFKGAQ